MTLIFANASEFIIRRIRYNNRLQFVIHVALHDVQLIAVFNSLSKKLCYV